MNTDNAKLRILKFESKTCAVCIAMNKKGVTDTLQKEYPGLEVIALTIADSRGESPEGTPYEEAYKLSDVFNVSNLPTYVIQDEDGHEMTRIEGSDTLTNFRKAIDGCLKLIAEVDAIDLAAATTLARVEAYKARVG